MMTKISLLHDIAKWAPRILEKGETKVFANMIWLKVRWPRDKLHLIIHNPCILNQALVDLELVRSNYVLKDGMRLIHLKQCPSFCFFNPKESVIDTLIFALGINSHFERNSNPQGLMWFMYVCPLLTKWRTIINSHYQFKIYCTPNLMLKASF